MADNKGENRTGVTLAPLEPDDREQFITDNQEAFLYGAVEEFGPRDDHFEEDGQIISRHTIETSIDGEHAEAYRILLDGEKVGGLVLSIEPETDGESEHSIRGELELLFISPHVHSKGIGFAAWQQVEAMHPEVDVWELVTPYFETRNIHFYVNKCGFHIVEFYNSHHPDPNEPEEYFGEGGQGGQGQPPEDGMDGMFRFEKVIRR